MSKRIPPDDEHVFDEHVMFPHLDRCGHGPEQRLVAAEWNLVVLSKAEADGGGAEVSARG